MEEAAKHQTQAKGSCMGSIQKERRECGGFRVTNTRLPRTEGFPGHEIFCPKTGTVPNRPRQLVTLGPLTSKACSFTGRIMMPQPPHLPWISQRSQPRKEEAHTYRTLSFPFAPCTGVTSYEAAAGVERV